MGKRTAPPWLRKMPVQPRLEVAVGWYSESEWALVKASAVDPDRFEDSYLQWCEMAEGTLPNLHAAGIVPKKHYIVANELMAWCLARGKANDAAARAEFVSEHAPKAESSPTRRAGKE
jgi:hypothetical protein